MGWLGFVPGVSPYYIELEIVGIVQLLLSSLISEYSGFRDFLALNFMSIFFFLQELLLALSQIANKYRVSISNVAVRFIADKPAVAAVIVGARLSISEHIASNQAAYSFPGAFKLFVVVPISLL